MRQNVISGTAFSAHSTMKKLALSMVVAAGLSATPVAAAVILVDADDLTGGDPLVFVTTAPTSPLFLVTEGGTSITFGAGGNLLSSSQSQVSTVSGGIFFSETDSNNSAFNNVRFSIFSIGQGFASFTGFADRFTQTFDLGMQPLVAGDNFFAFSATDGQAISGISFGVSGGNANISNLVFDGVEVSGPPPIGAVPEPTTWAMMLLGFGFIGGAMRSAKRRERLTVSYA